MRYAPMLMVGFLLFGGSAIAAECPVSVAARAGAERGYSRDQAAALEIEKRETTSSSTIGQCIRGISTTIVVPTFPSLSDVFAKAADKVCHVANSKIREAVQIPNINLPSTSGLPGSSIPVQITPPLRPPTHPKTDFWSRIWR